MSRDTSRAGLSIDKTTHDYFDIATMSTWVHGHMPYVDRYVDSRLVSSCVSVASAVRCPYILSVTASQSPRVPGLKVVSRILEPSEIRHKVKINVSGRPLNGQWSLVDGRNPRLESFVQ